MANLIKIIVNIHLQNVVKGPAIFKVCSFDVNETWTHSSNFKVQKMIFDLVYLLFYKMIRKCGSKINAVENLEAMNIKPNKMWVVVKTGVV